MRTRKPPAGWRESGIAPAERGASAATFHVEHRSRDPVVLRTRHTAEACRRGHERSARSRPKSWLPQRARVDRTQRTRIGGVSNVQLLCASKHNPHRSCCRPLAAIEGSARRGRFDMLASCNDRHCERIRSASADRAEGDFRSSRHRRPGGTPIVWGAGAAERPRRWNVDVAGQLRKFPVTALRAVPRVVSARGHRRGSVCGAPERDDVHVRHDRMQTRPAVRVRERPAQTSSDRSGRPPRRAVSRTAPDGPGADAAGGLSTTSRNGPESARIARDCVIATVEQGC